MKKYADKCKADFLVLDGTEKFNHEDIVRDDTHGGEFTEKLKEIYRILNIYDIYTEHNYDRILHLDSDMLIYNYCPNIFDEIPMDTVAARIEDNKNPSRRERLTIIQERWGDIGWTQGYTNAGTYLTSKVHKEIFTPYEGKVWNEYHIGSADTHMGYMLNYYKYKFQELSPKWNSWAPYDTPNPYILHFAGGQGVKLERIKKYYTQIIKQW
jgi:hypothetical protein